MKIQKRRRREHKTDYLNRLKLLKSGKPRIVFRKSNKFATVQYVLSSEAKDKIVFGITSQKLLDFGWDKTAAGSLKSITASYFTGLLAGKKVVDDKLEMPIVDFGMIRTIHGNKAYGFLKGLIDSGVSISCPEDAMPSEARIKGEHLKNKINFDEIKKKILGGKN